MDSPDPDGHRLCTIMKIRVGELTLCVLVELTSFSHVGFTIFWSGGLTIFII